MQKEEDWWSSVMKKSCALPTHGFIRKNKITCSMGGCEIEIDFVLVRKKYRKYVRDRKLIP